MSGVPQAENFEFVVHFVSFCTVFVEQIGSWAFWGQKIARFGLKILPRVSRAKRAEIFGIFLLRIHNIHVGVSMYMYVVHVRAYM